MSDSSKSWNYIISEKYKVIQLFKLHFLSKYSPMQLYTSIRFCKIVGNIPASHVAKIFSGHPSHV